MSRFEIQQVNNYSFKLGKEVYLLILVAVLALLAIDVFNIDFMLADLIYTPTESWQYKDAWVTSTLMHKYGKYLLILLYLVLLISFFVRNKQDETKKQRYGKIILLFSLLTGALLVAFLKHVLELDCPWNLVRYGGDKPFFSLFGYASSALSSSHCFPAGHASTAFTWVSLYFYAAIFYPSKQMKALFSVLILGFIFGLGQQLRGAHFISHDIWSLLVCLMVNVVFYKIAFSQRVLQWVT